MVVNRENANQTGAVSHDYVSFPRWPGPVARGGSVGNGGRNVELDLRAGIQLTPHFQVPTNKFGAFAHAVQAIVSDTPVVGQDPRVNAPSVISNAHPEMPVVVPDFHVDSLRLCMTKRIAHRFAGDSIDLVAEDWLEVAWSALDLYAEDDGRLVGFLSREIRS